MPSAGPLRLKVRFQAEVLASDGGGGNALTWSTVATVRGQLRPERSRERLEGGRVQDPFGGTLIVRSSSETRAITTEHRALIGDGDGVEYNIRSISNPDEHDKYLEMTVERATARGVTT